MPPTPLLLQAKREVAFLAGMGRMISPREAWLLAGRKTPAETLWSVAFRIGTQNDESPEEIHAYLEKQFPLYSMSEGVTHLWDDHHQSHHP